MVSDLSNSVGNCNSLVSKLVLVFLTRVMQSEIFLRSLNFHLYFFLHALQLCVSRGMFTALTFQLCSAKLTGAALIASTVACF